VDENNQLKTRIKNLLFVASKTQIGLKNYAPAVSQLEIGIPAGANGMTLSWRQYLGGTGALLGAESTPDSTKNSRPLKLLVSADFPIAWKFQNAHALAFRNDLPLEQEPMEAYYENGYWHAYLPLNFDRCEQRTVYISLLSVDYKYVLENINVTFDTDIDKNDILENCTLTGNQRSDPKMAVLNNCQSADPSSMFGILAVAMIIIIRFRRRNI